MPPVQEAFAHACGAVQRTLNRVGPDVLGGVHVLVGNEGNHGSPQQFHADLALDGLDRARRQIPLGMRLRHQSRLHRVLEVPVAAGGAPMLPAIRLKGPYDLAAIHVCNDTHRTAAIQATGSHRPGWNAEVRARWRVVRIIR